MNKTLVTLGVGIWAIILILTFVFRGSLSGLNLSCEDVNNILFPLTIIEIAAFVITLIGIIRRD
jgi:hypothetical protein